MRILFSVHIRAALPISSVQAVPVDVSIICYTYAIYLIRNVTRNILNCQYVAHVHTRMHIYTYNVVSDGYCNNVKDRVK